MVLFPHSASVDAPIRLPLWPFHKAPPSQCERDGKDDVVQVSKWPGERRIAHATTAGIDIVQLEEGIGKAEDKW